MKDRSLALAGLLQSVDAVVAIASNGRCDQRLVETALGSVFRIDADSAEAVYGGAAQLRRGLELLGAHAAGNAANSAAQGRIAFTVLQVERRLAVRADLLRAIQQGIHELDSLREREGLMSSTIHSGLGELYARTISTLTPRVLVQGDPGLLSRSEIVMTIRALLLAAVRSAVLWRQCGGSYWDFFLRRGQIARTATDWLRSLD